MRIYGRTLEEEPVATLCQAMSSSHSAPATPFGGIIICELSESFHCVIGCGGLGGILKEC